MFSGALSNYIASPGIGVNNDLWITNADGSKFWQLTRVQNRYGTLHPQFSPDGKKMLWSELIPSAAYEAQLARMVKQQRRFHQMGGTLALGDDSGYETRNLG